MSYIYKITCYRDRPFHQRSSTWTETVYSTCDLTGLIRPGAWLHEGDEVLQNPVIEKVVMTRTPHRADPGKID
jgi:hypothetical protein